MANKKAYNRIEATYGYDYNEQSYDMNDMSDMNDMNDFDSEGMYSDKQADRNRERYARRKGGKSKSEKSKRMREDRMYNW